MRHSQLRRLFLDLSLLASPVPLVLACGGTVLRSDDGHDNNAGAGGSTSSAGHGSGGAPMFMGLADSGGPFTVNGGAGGQRIYQGAGAGPTPPMYVGTGGYPVFMGTAPAGGAGGQPYYGLGGTTSIAGAGGAIYVGSGGAGGAIYTGTGGRTIDPDGDGGPVDAGSDAACPDGGPRGPAGCGRRPPGLEGAPVGIGGELCVYFQEMSRLEAASVPAFRRLGHELRLHGAPRRLLDAARRAAADEVVHTRLGRTLAERFGGRYVPPRIHRAPVRSLEELAMDNATEGGVRETFGAMVATWQGRAALDPVVRRIMRRVGVDETRHASLALRVLDWTNRKLSVEARRRVRDARRSSAADVLRELEWNPAPELVSLAGVPRREDAQRLAREMTRALWT